MHYNSKDTLTTATKQIDVTNEHAEQRGNSPPLNVNVGGGGALPPKMNVCNKLRCPQKT